VAADVKMTFSSEQLFVVWMVVAFRQAGSDIQILVGGLEYVALSRWGEGSTFVVVVVVVVAAVATAAQTLVDIRTANRQS
jgi:hypothetical protein